MSLVDVASTDRRILELLRKLDAAHTARDFYRGLAIEAEAERIAGPYGGLANLNASMHQSALDDARDNLAALAAGGRRAEELLKLGRSVAR